MLQQANHYENRQYKYQPEIALIIAVLDRAFIDYFYPYKNDKYYKERDDAREWLFETGQFSAQYWCELLGIIPTLHKMRELILSYEEGELNYEALGNFFDRIKLSTKYEFQNKIRFRVEVSPRARKANKRTLRPKVRLY